MNTPRNDDAIRQRLVLEAELLREAEARLVTLLDFTDNAALLAGMNDIINALHTAAIVGESLTRVEGERFILQKRIKESIELINENPAIFKVK